MKKFLYILIFLFVIAVCWMMHSTYHPFFQTKKQIPKINFLTTPIDLKIPNDYKKSSSEFTFQMNTIEEETKKLNPMIHIGQCHSFVDTPDALFNKLKKQPSKQSNTQNNPYQIDCGIIQTTFPLSF